MSAVLYGAKEEKMYALKYKGKFDFLCVSDTREGFDKKVVAAFWRWKGMQAYGNRATIEDFLSRFDKVVVTVEPYNAALSSGTRKD